MSRSNEKRLIDVNAIPESATAVSTDGRLFVAWSAIVEAPTVDAAEVVHGRWLNWKELFPNKFALLSLWKRKGFCSHCGAFKQKDNYCPNCGTKMDGDLK